MLYEVITIASNPKICKYLDMPLQHISDNMLVGDQTHLPSELAENKGHNVYYMLPLLLGLLGILYLIYGGKEGIHVFWMVTLLFVLRITSYNVCYTKLLRYDIAIFANR